MLRRSLLLSSSLKVQHLYMVRVYSLGNLYTVIIRVGKSAAARNFLYVHTSLHCATCLASRTGQRWKLQFPGRAESISHRFESTAANHFKATSFVWGRRRRRLLPSMTPPNNRGEQWRTNNSTKGEKKINPTTSQSLSGAERREEGLFWKMVPKGHVVGRHHHPPCWIWNDALQHIECLKVWRSFNLIHSSVLSHHHHHMSRGIHTHNHVKYTRAHMYMQSSW